MKKIYSFMVACLLILGSANAVADTSVVGSPDNTTPWWSAFSDYYTLEPNQTLKLSFTNYTDCVNNWDNFLAVLTNGKERGADGYAEYAVLRADSYGWGPKGNTNDDKSWFVALSNNYNWGTFAADMNGAHVDLSITRQGAHVTVHADVTTTANTTYFEHFTLNCDDGTQDMGLFLSTQNGHLVIDNDQTTTTQVPDENGPVVGTPDLSLPWWSDFSDYFTLAPDQSVTITFRNDSSKGGNYTNWVLGLCNNANRGETAYSEYFILRADAYGWGDNWNAANLSNDYNWDTFQDDMDGALVELTISRDGATVYVTANIETVAGDTYTEDYFCDCGDGEQTIRAFLTAEKAQLVIYNVEYQEIEVPGLVGLMDNTTPFFSEFSPYYTIEPDHTLKLSFKNYTNRAANFNNWIAVLTTDADRQADGYAEYAVLRADNYGWGDLYSTATITQNYLTNEEGIDWEAFKQYMDGANVDLSVARSGKKVVISADITTVDGASYNETLTIPEVGDGTQVVRSFLTVEGGHLIIDEASVQIIPTPITTPTAIEEVESAKASSSAVYNLQGVRVTAPRHGIYIQDGKKVVK